MRVEAWGFSPAKSDVPGEAFRLGPFALRSDAAR